VLDYEQVRKTEWIVRIDEKMNRGVMVNFYTQIPFEGKYSAEFLYSGQYGGVEISYGGC
jgi:hypothetical protein